MKNYFANHEQSLALKELGFDEPCLAVYYNPSKELFIGGTINSYTKEIRTLAPLKSQVFKWARENYDLFISINHYNNGYSINDLRRFETYEEAEDACIDKLIEIIKNQPKND